MNTNWIMALGSYMICSAYIVRHDDIVTTLTWFLIAVLNTIIGAWLNYKRNIK